MSKARVPLHGKPHGFVTVDTAATAGATVGVDLRWPDGRLVDLGAAPAPGAPPAPPAQGDPAVTYWRLIQEIPPNVSAVAALDGAGFVRRASGGGWSASPIVDADLSGASTSGLPEGTNLYFTDERAREAAADHYFAISQRFAELPNESAVIEARQNLGLQHIDGGTFN